MKLNKRFWAWLLAGVMLISAYPLYSLAAGVPTLSGPEYIGYTLDNDLQEVYATTSATLTLTPGLSLDTVQSGGATDSHLTVTPDAPNGTSPIDIEISGCSPV